MPQNIYDNATFYTGYLELREARAGLNDLVEQPALWSTLPPDLNGLRVLDIGCGFGDFARKARASGASHVLGLDVSQRMLAKANLLTSDSGIEYRRMSIEELDLDGETFDLVVSSLALHYVKNYEAAIERISILLKKGCTLAFSVEHPICTARAEQQWIRDNEGEPLYWPVDCYHSEGERRTKWFVDNVIKYHRTVETYVNGLLEAGFRLHRLAEPEPSSLESISVPGLELHRRRPPFLVLAAIR